MKCDFCNKEFATVALLNRHQRTAKFCLKLQEENGVFSNKRLFTCDYCKKEVTSRDSLTYHHSICKTKNQIFTIEQKQSELELEKQKLLQHVAELKKENDELRNRPTTINQTFHQETNHITNNLSILTYMTPELVTETFARNFTIDTLLGSETALAKFTLDQFLRGKTKPIYLCTDRSRKKFAFVNEQGKQTEDLNCEILLRLIAQGFQPIHQLVQDHLEELEDEHDGKSLLQREMIQQNYSSLLHLREEGHTYKAHLSKKLPSTIEEKERLDENEELFQDAITHLAEDKVEIHEIEQVREIGPYRLGRLMVYRDGYKRSGILNAPPLFKLKGNECLLEELNRFIQLPDDELKEYKPFYGNPCPTYILE